MLADILPHGIKVKVRNQSIISGGEGEAYRGNFALVRAEVEQECAAGLKSKSRLSRARIRLQIWLEITRRMKRYASARNLYSPTFPGGWLAWPIIACGLATLGCRSMREPQSPYSSPAPRASPESHDSGGVIEGRILAAGGTPISDAKVSLFRDHFVPRSLYADILRIACLDLHSIPWKVVATTRSAADSCYRFEELPEDTYTVRVTAPGFAWREVEVTVGEPTRSAWNGPSRGE